MGKDLESRVADLEARISALENKRDVSTLNGSSNRRNTSVNEFLKEKGPKTAMETTLVLAVYHERFNNADSFGTNDLLELIRKAKQKKPANVNDLINKNISKGYFEEDKVGEDKKKRWYVTSSGVDLVENNFNRDEQNT
jgi:hypothetical protein